MEATFSCCSMRDWVVPSTNCYSVQLKPTVFFSGLVSSVQPSPGPGQKHPSQLNLIGMVPGISGISVPPEFPPEKLVGGLDIPVFTEIIDRVKIIERVVHQDTEDAQTFARKAWEA